MGSWVRGNEDRYNAHRGQRNALLRPLCGYVGGIGSRALNPNLQLSTLKRFSNRTYRDTPHRREPARSAHKSEIVIALIFQLTHGRRRNSPSFLQLVTLYLLDSFRNYTYSSLVTCILLTLLLKFDLEENMEYH